MTFLNRNLLLTRVLPAVVVLLLLGRCGVSACDRPRFLGLSWSTEGASLSKAGRVLVFLHGFRGSGSDAEWFAEELIAARKDLAVVLPDGPYARHMGRAWYLTSDPAEREDSLARLLKLVDELVSRGVSPDRIYVGGFSQGAGMALDVVQAYPGLGGAVLLSGCGYRPGTAPDLRVFVGHGRGDTFCKFSEGEAVVLSFEKEGRQVTFFPYNDNHVLADELRAAVARFLADEPPPSK